MRLTLILVAAVLVGLCVWAVLRLCIDVCVLVGRGLCSLLGGGCCSQNRFGPGVHVRARDVRLQGLSDRVSRRVSERLAKRAGLAPRRCINPKCQWLNRPQAQFCAQCGRPLPQPKRTA